MKEGTNNIIFPLIVRLGYNTSSLNFPTSSAYLVDNFSSKKIKQ